MTFDFVMHHFWSQLRLGELGGGGVVVDGGGVGVGPSEEILAKVYAQSALLVEEVCQRCLLCACAAQVLLERGDLALQLEHAPADVCAR